MEDRITPATFNPTDAADLQSEFAYANSNPSEQVIINLTAGGAYNLADIGTQLVDQSTAGITINGNGATIIAAANNRIFEVDSGDQLALNNLTVTGGNLQTTIAQGGGIADFGGNLTLSAVNITQNSVQGSNSAQGGGLYVSGGSLTVGSSTIANNQAIGSGTTNISSGSSNSGNAATAFGGGLYVFGGSLVTITGSSLNGNRASGGDVGGEVAITGGAASGGGLCVGGNQWNVVITDSTLANNSVRGGSGGSAPAGYYGGVGGDASGGGLSVNGIGSGFVMLSTSISGNTAQGGNGGNGGGGGDGGQGGGGGMAFYASTPLIIQLSSFDSNRAIGGNGGTGTSGITGGNGGVASGGGVDLAGDVTGQAAAFTNNSITNNYAIGGNGGNGGNGIGHSYGGNGYGGGINTQYGSGLTLINTTVGGNTAQGGNAGSGSGGSQGYAFYAAGNAYGGGLYNVYGVITLINDTLAFNVAQAGSGGQTAAIAQGGGVCNSADFVSVTLTNVILESNLATTDGPDFYGAVDTSSGYDFISNTSGISNASDLSSMPGMILDNQTPQLDALTVDSLTGLSYYPLLANSQVIGAGTTSAVTAIAAAEGCPPDEASDELGYLGINTIIAMGAVAFFAPVPRKVTVTQNKDDGTGNTRWTLSWAINQELALVVFDLPRTPTINVTGQITIGAAMKIDGLSGQGGPFGTPHVELKGPGTGMNDPEMDGLIVGAPKVIVEGLAIDNFKGDGLDLRDTDATEGNGDTVEECYIGTDLSGANPNVGNAGNGIRIEGGGE